MNFPEPATSERNVRFLRSFRRYRLPFVLLMFSVSRGHTFYQYFFEVAVVAIKGGSRNFFTEGAHNK